MSRPPPLSTSSRPARYRRPFPCAGVRRRTSPVIKRRVPVQCWQLSFSGLNEFPELGMPPLPHDPRRSLSPPFVIITHLMTRCSHRLRLRTPQAPSSLADFHRALHITARLATFDVFTAVAIVVDLSQPEFDLRPA